MADKPLIFLIHGMGTYTEGWSKPVQDALNEHAQKFVYFKTTQNGAPLSTLVDFAEVTYDTVFQKALDNWQRNAEQLLQEVAPEDKETAEKAVGWLKGIGDTDKADFGWTHAADVVLWRFSPHLRNTVKAHVADEITKNVVEKIQASDLRSVKAAVISHSLGTAVAHDVLADLAAGRYTAPGVTANGFDPRSFRFSSLHTVANVSKILELEGYPVYTSKVRPGGVTDPNSYCKHFFNYHNKFDPFTHPMPFEPPWEVKWYHDKAVSHLYDQNPHSIEHYLLNPKVHVPMLRAIIGAFDAITPGEETAAVEAFENFGPEVQAKRAALEKRINDSIELMGRSIDMTDFVKGIRLFFGGKS